MKAKISNINFLSLCRIDAKASMCHFDAMTINTNSPDPTEATYRGNYPYRGNHSGKAECSDPTEATTQLKTGMPHRGNLSDFSR